ncbi:MAG TPA: BadF/BadG/BcrA/BcrD ATPase family protein [Ignavibacteria bacterium]
MKNFYMGIDAGGTTYNLISADKAGRVIFKVKKDALHLNTAGKDSFVKHLTEVIFLVCKKQNLILKDCKGICIGVAGARHTKDKDELARLIKEHLRYKNIILESDTEIARYGAFGGNDGLILISGTGSILYGKIRNKIYRIGGWGKILGDEGSGYQIAVNALKILAKEFDLNKYNSSLAKTLNKKFRITNVNLTEKVYRKNFDIQNLTPLIIELAKEGNKNYLMIIRKAVLELVELINKFFILSKEKKGDLVLCGSLIRKNNFFSAILKKEINKKFGKRIIISEPKYSPEFGAYLIAKNKFEKTNEKN